MCVNVKSEVYTLCKASGDEDEAQLRVDCKSAVSSGDISSKLGLG